MKQLLASVCLVLVTTIAATTHAAAPPAAQGAAAKPTAAATESASAGTKVVGSVRDVMLSMVMPSSEVVFNAGADAPKTDADWDALRLNAVELAESANLLMIGSRVRDRAEWMTMARAQLDAAEAVVRLATAKKVEGLSEASDKAYETCTTCHDKYWADRNKPK